MHIWVNSVDNANCGTCADFCFQIEIPSTSKRKKIVNLKRPFFLSKWSLTMTTIEKVIMGIIFSESNLKSIRVQIIMSERRMKHQIKLKHSNLLWKWEIRRETYFILNESGEGITIVRNKYLLTYLKDNTISDDCNSK